MFTTIFFGIPTESERLKREQIRNHFEKLGGGKSDPDFTFKVEDQEFPAHKAILSYRSSYFKKVFSSNMKESSGSVIQIENIKARVFKVLLQYIYAEEYEIEKDIAEDLFKLSHEYNLKKLNKDCEKILMKNIKVDNVINEVLFAERYEAEKLRKACLILISKNVDQVFSTQNFRDLETKTLIEIYKLSNWNGYTAQERFEYYLGRY